MSSIKIFFIAALLAQTFSSQAYEDSNIYCNVNNGEFTRLSCSGNWIEISGKSEVRIKSRECFGFKSSERLVIEIRGEEETYTSVLFPFRVRQNARLIQCVRADLFN